MIQAIITRLAGNSGALKGFAVPVVTALLGVGVDRKSGDFVWLGIYPVIVFCFLDAYYLALERRYRELYREAAAEKADTNWSLAAEKAGYRGVLGALKSPSIWAFYGAALVTVIVVARLV